MNTHEMQRFATNQANRRAARNRVIDTFTTPEQWQTMLVHPGNVYSEFEVQSFVYNELRSLGWDARGEVKTKCKTCRFDVIVYDDSEKPIAILEIKKGKPPKAKNRSAIANITRQYQTNQMEKYSKFGLPVLQICGMKRAILFAGLVRANGAKAIVGQVAGW